MSSVDPQAIIDAWNDTKDWIENTLPGLATGQSLQDEEQHAGDIGGCSELGGSGAASWLDDGSAKIKLSDLKLKTLRGLTLKTAEVDSDNNIRLPFDFDEVEVHGSYDYKQPCGLYEFGAKVASGSTKGNGRISQFVRSNRMYFTASFDDRLTLTGFTVEGKPDVKVYPSDGGLHGVLKKIADFFSTDHAQVNLSGNLSHVFLSDEIGNTMLGLLNAHFMQEA